MTTHISEAWHTTSWLDHCISTSDAHATLKTMEILYEYSVADHVPLLIELDIACLPELTHTMHGDRLKLDWCKLSKEDFMTYYLRTDEALGKIDLPRHAIMCTNVDCNDASHRKDLCALYDGVIDTIYKSSQSFLTCMRSKNIKPGWNRHVAAHHAEAKQAYKAWVQAGRPRAGSVLDYKKLTNARYKYAIRYVVKGEHNMRADSMAEHLSSNNVVDFWKEVRALNRVNTILPSVVDGVSGMDNIAELWGQHYSDLFNSVKSDPFKVESAGNNVMITPIDIHQAIAHLADNKSTGSDRISAEHLKYASPKTAVLLAMCFSGFMAHGFLPDSLLSVTLVPVIKDKAGGIGSRDNYRPIALASVVSKVLERVLLDRLGPFLCTTENQFGFKSKLGTDVCIYGLKETAQMYLGKNSSILIGFLDASKAFDRVNHFKLFNKLSQRGAPGTIVRLLVYWYSNQRMQVQWGNATSASFGVSNGVRQGGLLSPALFNLYMDELSVQLNMRKTGCVVGKMLINHFMYADDLAILSPSSAGFQQLLNVCSDYGSQYDVNFNPKKSAVLICRTTEDKHLCFPDFYLSGQKLNASCKTKYLGHFITDQLRDDDDIYRQRRMLYAQANTLARKFHMCSDVVKIKLFKTYCTPLYTASLWCKYKRASLQKLRVAYNDAMRILLKKPRSTSASQLFCSINVYTFEALLRHIMYRFILRLNDCKNSLVQMLVNPACSCVRYQSSVWKLWYKSLL